MCVFTIQGGGSNGAAPPPHPRLFAPRLAFPIMFAPRFSKRRNRGVFRNKAEGGGAKI